MAAVGSLESTCLLTPAESGSVENVELEQSLRPTSFSENFNVKSTNSGIRLASVGWLR